ncbi:hypothetical protein Trydic_g961 [Trypoxylus dichotomus]
MPSEYGTAAAPPTPVVLAEQQASDVITEHRLHLHILFLFRANWKYIRNKSAVYGKDGCLESKSGQVAERRSKYMSTIPKKKDGQPLQHRE